MSEVYANQLNLNSHFKTEKLFVWLNVLYSGTTGPIFLSRLAMGYIITLRPIGTKHQRKIFRKREEVILLRASIACDALMVRDS